MVKTSTQRAIVRPRAVPRSCLGDPPDLRYNIERDHNTRLLLNAPMDLPPIEAANALSLEDYSKRFFLGNGLAIPIDVGKPLFDFYYTLTLESSSTISRPAFEGCFDLMAVTSYGAYSRSSKGWSASKKQKEMRLPDLRYFLVKPSSTMSDRDIEGFMSTMFTYEDGHEVIYCYELHLSPGLRRYGIGTYLIKLMEHIGRKAGVEKAMLTVFVENQVALAFYEKLGYRKDDFSPEPRKLRNGVIKEADYVILSKLLN